MAHKIPAVIVGFESNGLGVARSLAKCRIPSIGLAAHPYEPSVRTNKCKVFHVTSWCKSDVINDLLKIGKRLGGKAPLIITKDEPVIWISEERDVLRKYYHINIPEDDVVRLLMDKQRFQTRCTQNGWPIPQTWVVKNHRELHACKNEIIFPCILKPAVKNSSFRKNASKKAFKIFNVDELTTVYQTVKEWEKEVVIQEWIDGNDDRIAYCLAYFGRKGDPIAIFPGRKLRQWPVECGNTAIAAPCPEIWSDKIIDLTLQIFSQVGYKGLGSIEFKMRMDGDIPVIMEPTVGRTNYQNEIAVINGINLPAIAYYDLTTGNYISKKSGTVPHQKLIDGSSDIKASWTLYHKGVLSPIQWLRSRGGPAKYMLLRSDDIKPFGAAVVRDLKKLIKYYLKYENRSKKIGK